MAIRRTDLSILRTLAQMQQGLNSSFASQAQRNSQQQAQGILSGLREISRELRAQNQANLIEIRNQPSEVARQTDGLLSQVRQTLEQANRTATGERLGLATSLERRNERTEAPGTLHFAEIVQSRAFRNQVTALFQNTLTQLTLAFQGTRLNALA